MNWDVSWEVNWAVNRVVNWDVNRSVNWDVNRSVNWDQIRVVYSRGTVFDRGVVGGWGGRGHLPPPGMSLVNQQGSRGLHNNR